MSFDEYHNSRWVAWPFHLFDCCLVTDSGAAIIVTTAERARSCRKQPVWVLGAAEGHDHGIISTMPSLTSLIARETGPKALARSGVEHQRHRSNHDLRFFHLYRDAHPGRAWFLRTRRGFRLLSPASALPPEAISR